MDWNQRVAATMSLGSMMIMRQHRGAPHRLLPTQQHQPHRFMDHQTRSESQVGSIQLHPLQITKVCIMIMIPQYMSRLCTICYDMLLLCVFMMIYTNVTCRASSYGSIIGCQESSITEHIIYATSSQERRAFHLGIDNIHLEYSLLWAELAIPLILQEFKGISSII